jgi:hypothetical protein
MNCLLYFGGQTQPGTKGTILVYYYLTNEDSFDKFKSGWSSPPGTTAEARG